MGIILYDLAAAENERRFSPYCWRVKMVLAHKGLAADQRAWRFTEKHRIAFAEHRQVPVLCDGEKTVVDSWQIMQYLERSYPQSAVFLAEPKATLYFKNWVEKIVHSLMFRCVVLDIHNGLHAADKDYFRQSREAMVGATLEDIQAGRDGSRTRLIAALEPIRATLEEQAFICGHKPTAADYLLFSAFQWCRCVSAYQLLNADSALNDWRERMLDLHGAYARDTLAYELSDAGAKA